VQHQALGPTLRELERRRWRTKRWRNCQGHLRGGRKFTMTSLHRLLTNVTYTGKVRYQNELYDGEQPAVVAPEIWQRVQELLRPKRFAACGSVGSGALLQGLLRCAPCGCAMTPISAVHGSKRYRYYLCCGAHRHGRQSCPSKSIPAWAIEHAVLEQIQNCASVAADNLDIRMATPAEQLRLVRLLIDRVAYDGTQKKVAITFRSGNLESMLAERTASSQEKHP
jgi:site-specific DNA recombinase